MDATVRGLLITSGVDILWFAVCFTVFVLFRSLRGDRQKGAPLLTQTPGPSGESAPAPLPRHGAPSWPLSFSIASEKGTEEDEGHFDWWHRLFQIDDDLFYSTDVQTYLGFLKCSCRLLCILSLVGLVVVLPVNWTAKPLTDENLETPLDRASAQNIPPGSYRFWILYGVTWLYSVLTYLFIYQYRAMITDPDVPIRQMFNPTKYTLLVRGIHRDNIDANILYSHFRKFHKDRVVTAHLVMNYSRAIEAEHDLKWAQNKLERTRIQNAQRQREEQPELSVRPFWQCFRRVPAVRYWQEEVHYRAKLLEKIYVQGPTKGAGLGFVSFTSPDCVSDSLADPRVVGHHYDWSVLPAPPPQDIIWENIHLSDGHRLTCKLVLNFLLFVFSVFIVSPVLVLNALNPLLQDLKSALQESNFFRLFLTAYLPPLILYVVNSLLLPTLVYGVAVSSGHWRKSACQASVLHGNIIFLILNSLILPLMSVQSISAVLEQIYQTQIQQWNITFGTLVLSSSGSFAIRYLINTCFLTTAAQLLQLPQVSYRTARKAVAVSESEIKSTEEKWAFDFGYWYAFSLSVLTIVLCFSVAVPFLVPLGALYFAMKYLVDKYNFTYNVYKVELESGGVVAHTVLSYMIFACAFLQFSMSGFFVIHGSKGLTLGGCILFIVSATTFGLLAFQGTDRLFSWPTAASMGKTSPAAEPTSDDSDRLGADYVEALKQAYLHPCEIARQQPRRHGLPSSTITSTDRDPSPQRFLSPPAPRSVGGQRSAQSPSPSPPMSSPGVVNNSKNRRPRFLNDDDTNGLSLSITPTGPYGPEMSDEAALSNDNRGKRGGGAHPG
ncbi:unnamed protein product [Vitrella brassicaformis CCMP3155]|uniref:CSC1/OSCA1-like 7TM region domain-containing protein n=1 Tax=Vitrella brassicaformis (strain CCMP3155) TaxID=1169540 RepID=A0A0G4G798_VITBC|nr:unnamed protein product [Vitrella brassicaformis CCMP3155]|eukprot:CEM24413.1 unnamed protein product [Vitrella brassicaformis CCMP3155]